MERLEDRYTPDTVTWTGMAGGGDLNWSNNLNWENSMQMNVVPQPNDDVVFPADRLDCVIDNNYTVKSLTIEAGYTNFITNTGVLTLTNGGAMHRGRIINGEVRLQAGGAPFVWTGGTIQTQLLVEANAQMTISDSANPKNVEGDGGAIRNYGRIVWMPMDDDTIHLKYSASVYNESGSTFEARAEDRTLTVGDANEGSNFFVYSGATLDKPLSTSTVSRT